MLSAAGTSRATPIDRADAAIAFHPFELERWMSAWEHHVETNLCESGVYGLSIDELLQITGGDVRGLSRIRLGYGQANGSDRLRAAIAALYPGASRNQVLVTTGSAEAIFLLSSALVGPGDRVVIPVPTYYQAWGMALNAGAHVVTVPMRLEADWEPDYTALRDAITANTRLVVITNPHNPTGHVLSASVLDMVVERCADVGAWLLADEIYQGAELDGVETPSLWGRYERTIVTNSVSKSYGLSGLRIGWVVAPQVVIDHVWPRHDYTVLAPNPLADFLAVEALGAREQLQLRTRRTLLHNWPLLDARLRVIDARLDGALAWRAPQAGAITFVHYSRPIASTLVAESLRADFSVLVAPGDHFGTPRHLRISIGNDPMTYPTALDALERGLVRVLW
jgi:aspartate/methionine/tyrosine aminotransferase